MNIKKGEVIIYHKGCDCIMTSSLAATVVGYILGALIVFCVAKILFVPLKTILKLILNSALGALILIVINLLEPILHIHIAVNAITSLVLGILGIPGLCLLMLLKIFF